MKTIYISMTKADWAMTLRTALNRAEDSNSKYEVNIAAFFNGGLPIEVRLDNEDMEDRVDLSPGTCFVSEFEP